MEGKDKQNLAESAFFCHFYDQIGGKKVKTGAISGANSKMA
jgi:hypothetical protein